MAIHQTLILIKPDGLVKSLTGSILTSLSETKLKIVGAKIVKVSRELAETHYSHLREKSFFEELVNYIMGKYHTERVFALVYEGEDAINKIRKIAGATNPEEADPISIRGKFGRIHSQTGVFENVIHTSSNEQEAEREIKLWFKPHELSSIIYPTKEKEIKRSELHWE